MSTLRLTRKGDDTAAGMTPVGCGVAGDTETGEGVARGLDSKKWRCGGVTLARESGSWLVVVAGSS